MYKVPKAHVLTDTRKVGHGIQVSLSGRAEDPLAAQQLLDGMQQTDQLCMLGSAKPKAKGKAKGKAKACPGSPGLLGNGSATPVTNPTGGPEGGPRRNVQINAVQEDILRVT